MKARISAIVLLALLVVSAYLALFATFGNDGTIMVGCSTVAQTRGGTICLDNAYKR
jgi:hypothetical protein